MITDIFSACASVIGALATLKGERPDCIMLKNSSGESSRVFVTYSEYDGMVYCLCNGFKTYAKITQKDFSIYLNKAEKLESDGVVIPFVSGPNYNISIAQNMFADGNYAVFIELFVSKISHCKGFC